MAEHVAHALIAANEELSSRIEEKFFLPSELKTDALRLFLRKLDPGHLDRDTHFTLVESTYFDSKSLDLFRDHFSSPNQRFKIRTRRYGPNGIWARDSAMVELKSKNGKTTGKLRFAISHEGCGQLSEGRAIEDSLELRRRNRPLKGEALRRRLSMINSAIQDSALRPVCRITYRRYAFETGGLRVTLDDELSSDLLRPLAAGLRDQLAAGPFTALARQMRDRFHERKQLILEIKHGSLPPAWLREFVAGAASPKVSFSKYCFGIAGGLA